MCQRALREFIGLGLIGADGFIAGHFVEESHRDGMFFVGKRENGISDSVN